VPISSLEDELDDDQPQAAEIREMLNAYRASVEIADESDTVLIDSWWNAASHLSPAHRVAWFPGARHLPRSGLPPMDVVATDWSVQWWQESSLDVTATISSFMGNPGSDDFVPL
jgi:hypothetical protein